MFADALIRSVVKHRTLKSGSIHNVYWWHTDTNTPQSDDGYIPPMLSEEEQWDFQTYCSDNPEEGLEHWMDYEYSPRGYQVNSDEPLPLDMPELFHIERIGDADLAAFQQHWWRG